MVFLFDLQSCEVASTSVVANRCRISQFLSQKQPEKSKSRKCYSNKIHLNMTFHLKSSRKINYIYCENYTPSFEYKNPNVISRIKLVWRN